MVAKLTRMTQKIVILWHLVAESCTTCHSQSSQQVRELLETPSYMYSYNMVLVSLYSLMLPVLANKAPVTIYLHEHYGLILGLKHDPYV
jgi:hypothetical protein